MVISTYKPLYKWIGHTREISYTLMGLEWNVTEDSGFDNVPTNHEVYCNDGICLQNRGGLFYRFIRFSILHVICDIDYHV